jgi:hypothetical protein
MGGTSKLSFSVQCWPVRCCSVLCKFSRRVGGAKRQSMTSVGEVTAEEGSEKFVCTQTGIEPATSRLWDEDGTTRPLPVHAILCAIVYAFTCPQHCGIYSGHKIVHEIAPEIAFIWNRTWNPPLTALCRENRGQKRSPIRTQNWTLTNPAFTRFCVRFHARIAWRTDKGTILHSTPNTMVCQHISATKSQTVSCENRIGRKIVPVDVPLIYLRYWVQGVTYVRARFTTYISLIWLEISKSTLDMMYPY